MRYTLSPAYDSSRTPDLVIHRCTQSQFPGVWCAITGGGTREAASALAMEPVGPTKPQKMRVQTNIPRAAAAFAAGMTIDDSGGCPIACAVAESDGICDAVGVREAHMRVLVVDDDPSVRGLLVDLLTLSGHTVCAASHGSEALALLETEHFDLILLDYSMPDMTGVAVLEKLRARAITAPVGLITGSRGHPDIEHLRRQAVPVLFKPFDLAECQAFLERLQGGRVKVSPE